MGGWDSLHLIGAPVALLLGAGVVLSVDLIANRRMLARELALMALAIGFGYTLWHAATGPAGAPGASTASGMHSVTVKPCLLRLPIILLTTWQVVPTATGPSEVWAA